MTRTYLEDPLADELPRPSRSARPGMLDLSRNELVHPALEPLLQRLLYDIPPSLATRYCSYPRLVVHLAGELACDPEALEIFPGSDDGIGVLLDAISRTGSTVVLQAPNYPAYTYNAQLRAVPVIPWLPKRDEQSARFDVADALTILRSRPPSVVVVTEPHGMLGTPLGELDLLKLSTATHAGGHILVVDECYQGFGPCTTAILNGPHIIRVGTFSKSIGLAGLRLGYVIGQPSVVDRLRRWRRAGAVSAVTAQIALELLRNHRRELDVMRSDVADGRDQLAGHFAARGWAPLRTTTNFLTTDLGSETTASAFVAHLASTGIAVRQHHDEFEGFVQITAAPWSTLVRVSEAAESFTELTARC